MLIATGVKYIMAVGRRVSHCVYVCVPNMTDDVQGTEVGKGIVTVNTVIVHTKTNIKGV